MSGIEILGGRGLPPGLGEALLGALSGHDHDSSMKPATKEQIAGLLEATKQPKLELGDIVVLRDHATDRFKWPQPGEEVIVSQVLEAPYRSGDVGTSEPTIRADIALAFACSQGHIHESLHDSRNFRKVGSIYD